MHKYTEANISVVIKKNAGRTTDRHPSCLKNKNSNLKNRITKLSLRIKSPNSRFTSGFSDIYCR